MMFLDQAGDPIQSRENLEDALIDEYQDLGAVAFSSEVEKAFIEYREGLEKIG
jgi:hypothetical protein